MNRMLTATALAAVPVIALAACGTSTHPASQKQACTAAADAGAYVAKVTGDVPSSKEPDVIRAELKAATWRTAAERSAARRLGAVIGGGASQGDYASMLSDSLILFRACDHSPSATP